MIEIIEALPVRVATKSATELDAVEHAGDLVWQRGERAEIRKAMNRRHRREVRRTLRTAF